MKAPLNELRERGYYGARYVLQNVETKSLEELKIALATDPIKYTGWTPFWIPNRSEIRPKLVGQDTYECIHDGSGPTGHIEKWRATTNGEFTIIRAHNLDHIAPGDFINLILPIWRIAELLLHAGRMGQAFSSDEVEFTVLFTGLKGRVLTTKETPGRILSRNYQIHVSDYEQSIVVPVSDIDRQIAEYTDRVLRPFYGLFEYPLPADICEQEISRMRAHRF